MVVVAAAMPLHVFHTFEAARAVKALDFLMLGSLW
jgi:hypothetical protein